jgi:putative hydrolase of the HAD superfamily
MTRLQAVGFDLWETLITNPVLRSEEQNALRVSALNEVLLGAGHVVDPTFLKRAYRDVWDRCHELYWSRDVDITTEQQIIHLLELLDIEVDGELIRELETAYASTILHSPPEIIEGAEEVLAELSERNLRIGLISNTGRTPGWALRKILERFELARYLDAMVFSNEHGICKPQEAIFRTLLEQLGVEPEAMAFVGDNKSCDVQGARRVGMIAIHFDAEKRGTAFAPESGGGLDWPPHATIRNLRDLPRILDSLAR